MFFVFFGRFRPFLRDPHPDLDAECLVFDDTVLYELGDWLREFIADHQPGPYPDVYRVVQSGAMMDWPDKCKVVKLHDFPVVNTKRAKRDDYDALVDEDNDLLLPFDDDIASVTQLLRRIKRHELLYVLPQLVRGVSQIEQYALGELDATKFSFKERVYMCAAKFHVPIDVVLKHLTRVKPFEFDVRVYDSYKCVPVVLVNGDFPLPLKPVARAVHSDDINLDRVPHDPELEWSEQSNGYIWRLPYGTTPADFPDHEDESSTFRVWMKGPRVHRPLGRRRWRCVMPDGNLAVFTSANELLKHWREAKLDELQAEIHQEEIQRQKKIRIAEFAREHWLRLPDPMHEKGKRFIAQTRAEKLESVKRRFDGDLDFLRMPLEYVGPDFGQLAPADVQNHEFDFARARLKRGVLTFLDTNPDTGQPTSTLF